LWQGRKINIKKFHLISWNIVRPPKDSGDREIEDPILVNITLGVKILWWLVMSKSKWWKEVMIKNTSTPIGKYAYTKLWKRNEDCHFGSCVKQ
jgi:hypothetical protein